MMVDAKKCLPSCLCYTKKKKMRFMRRPKDGTNVSHSKKERTPIFARVLENSKIL